MSGLGSEFQIGVLVCWGLRAQAMTVSVIDLEHVHEPTREHYLLDILATSDPDLVSSIPTVDSRSVSDHKLVIA